MDHMMPEVDGVEATIKIRKTLNSMIHPVIIALSANVVEEAKRLFKNAGMNDFVAKPVDIKDLATKIKKWLPEDKIIPVDPDAAEDAAADAQVEVPAAQKVKYSGFDTETALRSLGSIALYDKILEEYYRSGRDKFEGIRQAYASEDWADYTIRVHALKSSSRQIGALGLGDMAEELEKAGKASDLDTIKAKTADTLQEYSAFLEALGGYYGTAGSPEDEADKPLIDPDTLRELMDELKQACDDLDMDLMESVSERLAGYNYDDEKKSVIDELQQAISSMDTEKCEELIGVIS
jgi:CheY-like chemotaxis protein